MILKTSKRLKHLLSNSLFWKLKSPKGRSLDLRSPHLELAAIGVSRLYTSKSMVLSRSLPALWEATFRIPHTERSVQARQAMLRSFKSTTTPTKFRIKSLSTGSGGFMTQLRQTSKVMTTVLSTGPRSTTTATTSVRLQPGPSSRMQKNSLPRS